MSLALGDWANSIQKICEVNSIEYKCLAEKLAIAAADDAKWQFVTIAKCTQFALTADLETFPDEKTETSQLNILLFFNEMTCFRSNPEKSLFS